LARVSYYADFLEDRHRQAAKFRGEDNRVLPPGRRIKPKKACAEDEYD
jgi:hypothetical protein